MQIQRLGIELRKIGNVKSLYEDVDTVLKNYGLNDQIITRDVQVQTTAHALQKLFKTESHFSVCTIDKLMSLCQISITSERLKVYNSIHCMNWNEMLPEYRQMIVAMILDDFREVLNKDE